VDWLGTTVFPSLTVRAIQRRAVAYLECAKGGGPGVWGTEVPSGVQGQSPGRGSGGRFVPQKLTLFCY